MAADPLTLFGGLLLGLASSLHCAGMCGPIASSLMFAFSPGGSPAERARALFSAHAGRILMYVAAGTAVGALGSTVYGAFDHSGSFAMIRWAGAVALGWIGLSVAGLAPSLAGLDRLGAPIAATLRFAPARESGAFVSGALWGFLPCGMVYGALFYALLSGSALSGASVMAGFGLGTLPSVTAVAFGLSHFRRFARTANVRLGVGLGIVALSAASLLVPAIASGALCLH
jgi:uncharacterized protein